MVMAGKVSLCLQIIKVHVLTFLDENRRLILTTHSLDFPAMAVLQCANRHL